jgi:hypothetical protein
LAVVIAVAASAAAAFAQDAQDPNDSATGGGEFILTVDQEPHPGEGPGDTIAFTAQAIPGDDSDAAEGEVQEVDRVGAFAGRGSSIFHSEVFCLNVNGNEAVIAFRPKSASAPPDLYHQMLVIDVGEGTSDDLIFVDHDSDTPPCTFPELPGIGITGGALARGTTQVFDAP